MTKMTLLLAATCLLGACAVKPQNNARLPGDLTSEVQMDEAGGFGCEADAAAELIGQTPSQPLGKRALALTGARSLRWIAPDSAVTMDFREDRLNIYYDADYKVERITCE